MTYSTILGGNSADRDNVFKLQKRTTVLELLQIPATGPHVMDYLKN
jgi:hypothetical protein